MMHVEHLCAFRIVEATRQPEHRSLPPIRPLLKLHDQSTRPLLGQGIGIVLRQNTSNSLAQNEYFTYYSFNNNREDRVKYEATTTISAIRDTTAREI